MIDLEKRVRELKGGFLGALPASLGYLQFTKERSCVSLWILGYSVKKIELVAAKYQKVLEKKPLSQVSTKIV